jgi:hypothetical protein
MNKVLLLPTTAVSSAGLKTADAAAAFNNKRRKLLIQNQKATKLFVKFGAGCTESDYDIILAAATGAEDGSRLPFELDTYTGIVSVKDGGGTADAGSYTLTEFIA